MSEFVVVRGEPGVEREEDGLIILAGIQGPAGTPGGVAATRMVSTDAPLHGGGMLNADLHLTLTPSEIAHNSLGSRDPVSGAAHAAASITNTPAGNIAATNVQTALNELDTEKLAVGGPASSVANTPAGNIAATNVQAALNELDTGKHPAAHCGARVYHSTTQTFSQGSSLAVLFNSERYDTNGFHDTSSNTSRITIPTGFGGYYLIGGAAATSTTGAATKHTVSVRLNGTTVIGKTIDVSPSLYVSTLIMPPVPYYLSAGDYVELLDEMDGTGTATLWNESGVSPVLWVARMGS